jgi:hypothetical protein
MNERRGLDNELELCDHKRRVAALHPGWRFRPQQAGRRCTFVPAPVRKEAAASLGGQHRELDRIARRAAQLDGQGAGFKLEPDAFAHLLAAAFTGVSL